MQELSDVMIAGIDDEDGEELLPPMPDRYRGQKVYYTLLSVQYGPLGRSVFRERLAEELMRYGARYDNNNQHKGFAEQIIGFQMVGTLAQASAYQNLRDEVKRNRKKLKKLRFQKKMRCPFRMGKLRCTRVAGHDGNHSMGK
jgi:hypothetical protein